MRCPCHSDTLSLAEEILDKSHFAAPVLGVLEKIDDLLILLRGKIVLGSAGIQDIVPVREHMELNVVLH